MRDRVVSINKLCITDWETRRAPATLLVEALLHDEHVRQQVLPLHLRPAERHDHLPGPGVAPDGALRVRLLYIVDSEKGQSVTTAYIQDK